MSSFYIKYSVDFLCVKSGYGDEQMNTPVWPIVTCNSRVNTFVCIRQLHF